MNRKNMPLILMLTAGACTCIVTMVQAYSVLASLVALFAVMLLFYCLGNGVRLLLDRFDRQNEEKAKQEQDLQQRSLLQQLKGQEIGRCTTEGCKRVKWMKPVRKGY